MKNTRSIFLSFILGGIILSFSSCATLLRAHNDGDFKNGINVVVAKAVPDFKCTVNGSELPGRMVYDGTPYQSPFLVYRVNIKGHPKHLNVKVGSETYEITRTHKPGWFWVGGLWVFVDIITGAYYYYPDLNAS